MQGVVHWADGDGAQPLQLLVEVLFLISTQCQGAEIGKVWRRRSVGGIRQGSGWSQDKGGGGGFADPLMYCAFVLAPDIVGNGDHTTQGGSRPVCQIFYDFLGQEGIPCIFFWHLHVEIESIIWNRI
jgi:hypothetical protein